MYKEQNEYGILRYLVIIIGSILLAKLFMIQVINPSYKLKARNNVVNVRTEIPSRGLIYDRKGKTIVYNDPVYDVYVTIKQLEDFDTLKLCSLLEITPEDFQKRMDEVVAAMSPRKPVAFVKNITTTKFAKFQEHLHEYNGFTYVKKNIRRYPYNGAAHVLGYISEVNDKIIEESNEYYSPGDYCGTIGLEKSYEKELRGIKGIRFEIVDVFNNVQGAFKNGNEDVIPVAGIDLMSSLSIDLQVYGEQLMQNKIGSVVAIDPGTGEILAYISSPAYDPNLLSGRYRGQNYAALSQDTLKPLYNRPVSAAYPPGSTFKTVMSLIAFQEGIISPDDGYSCNGGYRIPGHTVGCHPHAALGNGRDAIRVSCNAYYCNSFAKLLGHEQYANVEEAYNVWVDYMHKFGYGHPIGVDLVAENKGNVQTAEKYNKIYGKGRWKATTIISLAIGQGETLATPLQMANTMAIISNKGYYYPPHLVRAQVVNDTAKVLRYEKIMVDVDAQYFDYVIDGMEDVFVSGTGRGVYKEGFPQCGKTGTAENPHGKDHSIFVAFAPKVNPKIAIAVIVENAGFGATYAAPIASLMMEKYLNDSISEDRKKIEERMFKANLISNEDKQ
jgi:penicillin-binding protein 2